LNLRLNKRLGIYAAISAVSIAASTTLYNFELEGLLQAASLPVPTFSLTPGQWFRIISPRAQLWDSSQAGGGLTGSLTIANAQLVVALDPEVSYIIAWASSPPAIVNPVGDNGIGWGEHDVALMNQTDLLQAVGHPFSLVLLDLLANITNADAVNAHTVGATIGGVVEIFDEWDHSGIPSSPDIIGPGGPVTSGYRRA
jgi:hypothetical protein